MATLEALANPIWLATTTRHRHFATGEGPARRYLKEIIPLAAIEDHSPEAQAALSAIVSTGERIWMFLSTFAVDNAPALDPRHWRQTNRIFGYQMILEDTRRIALEVDAHPPSVSLDSVRDAAEIHALKQIAFPGFFSQRTPEMGRYRGIRVPGPDGRPELVAMAGERLAVPGYREVSAVCTHPAHLGRGYAQRLTREAAAVILADGDIPFLHVAGANQRAIAIYERLGFVRCADVVFVEFERLGER